MAKIKGIKKMVMRSDYMKTIENFDDNIDLRSLLKEDKQASKFSVKYENF